MLLSPRYAQMHFSKEYMPGYTGHVPTKVDRFGMTAGDVNRVIVEDFNPPPTAGTFSPKLGLYQETSLSNMTPKNKPFKNVFGNCSRYATNWISGPTHEMCQQHIPGYIGHVPGLISENLYSKSYAKCTQAAIGRRMPRGHDVEAKVRFMSTQKLEYTDKNHRRIAENVDNRVIKDYADYSKYVNGQFSRQKETILTQTLQSEDQEATTIVTTSPKLKKSKLTQALNQLRMQTARHAQTMGRRNDTFRTVASTPKQRRISFAGDMEQTLSPTAGGLSAITFKQVEIKPRLLETKITEDENFMKVSDGFRKLFANDKEDLRLVLPISGYGGHRRGDRSQNFFGKPFREISIQSKRLQRQLQQTNSPADASDL